MEKSKLLTSHTHWCQIAMTDICDMELCALGIGACARSCYSTVMWTNFTLTPSLWEHFITDTILPLCVRWTHRDSITQNRTQKQLLQQKCKIKSHKVHIVWLSQLNIKCSYHIYNYCCSPDTKCFIVIFYIAGSNWLQLISIWRDREIAWSKYSIRALILLF